MAAEEVGAAAVGLEALGWRDGLVSMKALLVNSPPGINFQINKLNRIL